MILVILKSIYFYFKCLSILPAYMSVYHKHVWHLWMSEEAMESLENEGTDARELACACLELTWPSE